MRWLALALLAAACSQEPDAPASRRPRASAPAPEQCAALPERIRIAGDALQNEPPDPDGALAIYREVLALESRGCVLSERDQWNAREGAAIAHLMKGQWRDARPILEDEVRRWPAHAGTRYNLACALCRSGDLEACLRELDTALDVAAQNQPPAFLADQARPASYFADLARRDPDLQLLRADPRFERVLSEHATR